MTCSDDLFQDVFVAHKASEEVDTDDFDTSNGVLAFRATRFAGALIFEFDGRSYHAEVVINPVGCEHGPEEWTSIISDDLLPTFVSNFGDPELVEETLRQLYSACEDGFEGGTPGSESR